MNKLFIRAAVCSMLAMTAIEAHSQEARGRGVPPRQGPPPQPVETRLQQIISTQGIQPIQTSNFQIPEVSSASVQLGKKLFFSKILGGEQSVACVSCHHPSLGGADALSLSVGVDAIDELDNNADNLLGQGRFNGNAPHPQVPRNAPSIFNIALFEQSLFWDGRVERLRNGAIATPDSEVIDGRRRPDTSLTLDTTLAAAQARFPVTSVEEMRGQFLPSADNHGLRQALTSRLNDDIADISSNWPAEFAAAFGDEQVTTERVYHVIGEYQRSMMFINSPWQRYLQGDRNALTEAQKQGAILFFTPPQQGGAGCAGCHNGNNFSDGRYHLVAFPQVGQGKNNQTDSSNSQDFGRENITNNQADRYHFRTPSLLNIETSAPYGHTGAYATLEQVVEHYNNPTQAINHLFGAINGQAFTENETPYCQLPQIELISSKQQVACQQIFPDAFTNSIEVANYLAAVQRGEITARAPLRARAALSPTQVSQVAQFLRALTDPCTLDKSCLSPWLLDNNDVANFPDNTPLIAVDQNGNSL